MKATEQLKAEHEGIMLMLGVLGEVCDKLESGERIGAGELGKMLEFLQTFADRCHHGKEEDLLFPALVKAGMSRSSGPIAALLAEHEQGRGFIRGMAEALRRYGKGGGKAGSSVAKNLRGYIALLTQHIQKENDVLFPMADQLLGEERQSKLLEGFEKLEVERIGAGKHEEFHRLLGSLEKEYLG